MALAAKAEQKRNLECDFPEDPPPPKDRILPTTAAKAKKRRAGEDGNIALSASLESRARDIQASVDELRAFLLSSRDLYLGSLWTGEGDLRRGMDDRQRDKVDASANGFMRTANALIAKFKADLRADEAAAGLSDGQRRHLEAVAEILESYLKSVCDIYSEQRAIRMERELQFQKLSRLEIKARKSEL